MDPEWDIFQLNRETSDEELDRWGKRYIPGFLGVVARNEFTRLYPNNKPMPPGTSCIINLDYQYRRNGTHWCSVRVSDTSPLLMYIDSFGLPPPREVTNRGRLDGRGILYSDIRSQRYAEVNCGPRALAVLHGLAHAKNDLNQFGELAQV